jgi:hypothetical protein
MAEHGRTSRGIPITDALIAELAEQAEQGYDVVAILRHRLDAATDHQSARWCYVHGASATDYEPSRCWRYSPEAEHYAEGLPCTIVEATVSFRRDAG